MSKGKLAVGKYVIRGGRVLKKGKGLTKVLPYAKGLGGVASAGVMAGMAIGSAYGKFSRAQRKYTKGTMRQADALIKTIKKRRKKR